MNNVKIDSTDRGQVGIGTLIVFIALVLVAAIAAGVLINTAGFLQSQAEATGEDSTSQVSDRMQIQSASGLVVDDTGASGNVRIEEATLLVSLAPGADPVDLSQTTVELANGDITQLTSSDLTIQDTDGAGITTLGGDNDKAQIVINLVANASPLTEAENLGVTITTANGGSTEVELQAPRTLTTSDDGSAVEL